MDITIKKNPAPDALITVELSREDYRPAVEKKVKEYSRKATIKGFRKGKVPGSLIQRMYGDSILAEEVNTLVVQAVSRYLHENALKTIGDPLPNKPPINVSEWGDQETLKFEFQIGLVDDFKCDVSSKIKIQAYSIKIDDPLVQQTVEKLKTNFGTVVNPEISEANDRLRGELKEESSEAEPIMGYLNINHVKPSEQKKFIGKKKGDRIVFDINRMFTSPEHKAEFLNLRSVKEAKSKRGTYRLDIAEIFRAHPATLNQDFFDKVLGPDAVRSEEGFHSKIQESLHQQYQHEANQLLEQHICRHFIKKTKMKLPENFLKAWLKKNISNGQANEKELQETLEKQKETLKWDLIKQKIASNFAVAIQDEEVRNRAKELLSRQYAGLNPDLKTHDKIDAFVEQYLSVNERENFFKIKTHLQHERVLHKIKENITIKEKLVSLDDFKKIVSLK